MKAPDALIAELLDRVRREFYPGAKAKYWFGQQQMVKKALLHPAACLHKMSVELPAARYQAIVNGILDTARDHGNLDRVTFISRYLLHCFQKHMEHHGDKYYREGVAVRNRISVTMTAIERARIGADGTIPTFAQADQVLQVGKRKAKVTPIITPDLFSL